MNNTTRAPSGTPHHSQFVATAMHTMDRADGERKLPSPTVRMLTCLHYLVRPKKDTSGAKAVAISTVKGVLTAMAQHVDPDGIVFLSVERIGWMSGYTDRAVQAALRYSEKQGYIRVDTIGGGRGATRYQVLLMNRYFEAATINKNWRPQTPARCSGVDSAPAVNLVPRPPHLDAKTPARRSPDPIRSEKEPISTYPYKTHEETKRDLARVFAQH
jgi:hypothetical protein